MKRHPAQNQQPNKFNQHRKTTMIEKTNPTVVEQVLYVDDNVVEQQPTEAPTEKPTEESNKPVRKKHNAIQIFDHTSKQVWDSEAVTIVLPGDHDKETRDAIQRAPNVSYVDNPAARDWAQALQDGLEMTSYAEGFLPALEEDGRKWTQAVDVGNAKLAGQSPRFKPTENENLKGERAVIRVMSQLGLGSLFQVPLWHTGIWVTIKPPTETEIVELHRIMAADKIQFGRFTYGLAFANMSSYTVGRLVDFVIDHIYDTTVKTDELPIGEMKKFISAQDYPSLIWGMACSMFANGFQYRRPCSTDPEKCNYILEETLNVSKLQWTDNNALTDWQKTHMSVRQSKCKDKASVLRYKEELSRIQNTTFVLKEDGPGHSTKLVLGTPSIEDYIEAGQRWIGEITETVERALSVDTKDDERNRFIRRRSQATAMRNFMHWVKAIELDTNIIDDRETIESTLNVLSSDDGIRTAYNKAVIDYINKSTISLIGIPVFECPNCHAEQTSDTQLHNHANIIPLDVMQVFFGLLYQKLDKITAR